MIIREARGQRVCLIHARSYIPATAALLVSRVTGIPFIFDMRALWLEELITAGRLRRNSTLHKVMIVGERACLRHAGAIISLTNASVRYLQEVYSSELRGKKVVVIPTCADLSRFKPIGGTQTEKVVGCLGTLLSGWFRLDWLAEFLRYAASKDLQIRFQITTLDDPELVRAKIGGPADLKSRLEVVACPAHRVHEVLQGQVASVMFYAGGETSELGRCPTRMAEILGCGLPLVANEGVGDVAEIIREYRVGVLMSGPTEEEVAMAWEGLIKLLNDPETGARCRKVAEKFFSLESGTAAFLAVYDSMQGIYQ